jgi:hypothetical protein
MRGVQRGSGPSSKLSAIFFRGARPRQLSSPWFQNKIGPAPCSGPCAARTGVALRPVVRVERP